ncbi:MAG: hypothetical protein ACW992_13875, partial [Candidatus Thorarchaeota archaeon]
RVEFGELQPTIPETILDWNQLPLYPVSLVFSNGSEWEDWSSLLPALTYFVLPIGNWSLITGLAETAFENYTDLEVDTAIEYWDYYFEVDSDDASIRMTATATYNKESGVLFVSGVYVNPRSGGGQIGSIFLSFNPFADSPRQEIYIIYLIIVVSAMVGVAIWIKRMK